MLFFGDAIVAIAITLLALNLKLDVPPGAHLSFIHLIIPWKNILAFTLLFINIAGFWKTHHDLFIVTLPFTTSVLITHFGDSPAIFLYSLNVFMVTTLQDLIWYYAVIKEKLTDNSGLGDLLKRRFQLMCNLDIITALIAVVLSFFHPTLPFFIVYKSACFNDCNIVYCTRTTKGINEKQEAKRLKQLAYFSVLSKT